MDAATFFANQDEEFESSHYQILNARSLGSYATFRNASQAYRPTTNLLCGPMIPMNRPSRREDTLVLSPPGDGAFSCSSGSKPSRKVTPKFRSMSLENLVELPEETTSNSSLESDDRKDETSTACLVVEGGKPARSALKPSCNPDEEQNAACSPRRSLTVTFEGLEGDREVDEITSTPRKFLQQIVSPVLDRIRGPQKAPEKQRLNHDVIRNNSLGMQQEPNSRPWVALFNKKS